MNNPNRKLAVKVGATWYETNTHQEKDGTLIYMLHDGYLGQAKAGEWKPIEQARLIQEKVGIKKIG